MRNLTLLYLKTHKENLFDILLCSSQTVNLTSTAQANFALFTSDIAKQPIPKGFPGCDLLRDLRNFVFWVLRRQFKRQKRVSRL